MFMKPIQRFQYTPYTMHADGALDLQQPRMFVCYNRQTSCSLSLTAVRDGRSMLFCLSKCNAVCIRTCFWYLTHHVRKWPFDHSSDVCSTLHRQHAIENDELVHSRGATLVFLISLCFDA